MEGLLIVVALVVLGIPVAVIGLIISQSGVKERLSEAERKISDLRNDLKRLNEGGAATPPPRSTKPAAQLEPLRAAPAKAAAASAPPDMADTPPKVAAAKATPPPVTRSASEVPRPPSPVATALAQLGPWLQQNWFYAVSAASLALAGIFLVQYGMENGLLPPRARVAAALAFGAALIGVGEFIRRRFGDDAQSVTEYLPSVFSGAGIVTLFGGILSARMLYDLIGGGAAMGGMVIVALVAMVLGWMHGPLLVAVGVIGAYAAPVVLESSNSDASPLFGFFAVIAVLGLGVDTIRRWGWISALTLVLAYFMGFVLLLGGGSNVRWTAQVYFAVLPLLAILIPARSLVPDHAGPPATLGLLRRLTLGAKERGLTWPAFPTLLAFSSVAASSVIVLISYKPGAGEIWLSVALLSVLSIVLISWSDRAPALQDAALLPPVTLLLSIFAQAENGRATYRQFTQTYAQDIEAAFPWIITIFIAIGAAISLMALWRALRAGQFGVIWALIAAVFAPAMAIMLEMTWRPAEVIGAYPWALHAAGLAALMAFVAERLARADGAYRLRVSFAVMSMLACLAFAFVIVLSSVALTVALAVTVLAAAALDRTWNLPAMTWFIAVGVITLGYRLVVDPGLEYGGTGPLAAVLVAYCGTLAVFIAALWLLRPLEREAAKVMLDSAAWSTGGLTVSILLLRWIESYAGSNLMTTHWTFGLNAAIWSGLALAQVQRTQGGTEKLLDKARWVLATIFGLIGGSALVTAMGSAPVFATTYGWGNAAPLSEHILIRMAQAQVYGPVLFNTLAAAYLVPAAVLLAGAWRLGAIDARMRMALGAVGAALVAFWGFTVIRHFWQGGDAMPLSLGIGQPEQYTYTIVLLLAGAGLFYQSLARRSALIRKAGLVVIGLAVAKVFLIDVTDLDGLTRVFSLLVLGLALAALAWLNRWAQERDRAEAQGPVPPPSPPTLD
ncbi:DUF2339 domain-containing protein [Sulfitobacter sp. HNIBRBA2951]|uniref:DUF2339 domain-containing protein n=1 Tax=Sulfitobacter aquimarinus TaxID=3158557 RepID=UPI0032DE9E21